MASSFAREPPSQITRIGYYELQKTIGKGNFAKVKLAKHVITKSMVAVKIFDKKKLKAHKDIYNKVLREVEILKRVCEHPNITKMYQVMETANTIHMVTEYAEEGELFDYIKERGRLPEPFAAQKFSQLVDALHFCHLSGIVHRDLKAENVLLDANLNIKIADFGFSNYYTSGSLLSTFCGSPPYAAPELFEGKKYDGTKSDVWSLGVLLFVTVSGYLPFAHGNTRDDILKGIFRVPYFMTSACEELVRKMIQVDPEKRLTLHQIMDHNWMKSNDASIQLNENRVIDGIKPSSPAYSLVVEQMSTITGLNKEVIDASVKDKQFDNISGMFHLLYDQMVDVKSSDSLTRSSDSSSVTVSSEQNSDPVSLLSPLNTALQYSSSSVQTEINQTYSDVEVTFDSDNDGDDVGGDSTKDSSQSNYHCSRRHTVGPSDTHHHQVSTNDHNAQYQWLPPNNYAHPNVIIAHPHDLQYPFPYDPVSLTTSTSGYISGVSDNSMTAENISLQSCGLPSSSAYVDYSVSNHVSCSSGSQRPNMPNFFQSAMGQYAESLHTPRQNLPLNYSDGYGNLLHISNLRQYHNIKDQNLLKPPSVIDAAGGFARRASDGGAHFHGLLHRSDSSSSTHEGSDMGCSTTTEGTGIGSSSGLDQQPQEQLGDLPQTKDEDINQSDVVKYISGRGSCQRATLPMVGGVGSSQESPPAEPTSRRQRTRRTGLLTVTKNHPVIADDLRKEAEARIMGYSQKSKYQKVHSMLMPDCNMLGYTIPEERDDCFSDNSEMSSLSSSSQAFPEYPFDSSYGYQIDENVHLPTSGIMAGLPVKSSAQSLLDSSSIHDSNSLKLSPTSMTDSDVSSLSDFNSNVSQSSLNGASNTPGIVSGIPVFSPSVVSLPEMVSGLPVFNASVAGITSGLAMSHIRTSNSHGILAGRPARNIRRSFTDNSNTSINSLNLNPAYEIHKSAGVIAPGITSGIPFRKTSHESSLQIPFRNTLNNNRTEAHHHSLGQLHNINNLGNQMDLEISRTPSQVSDDSMEDMTFGNDQPDNFKRRKISCPTFLGRTTSNDDLTKPLQQSCSNLFQPPSPYFPHPSPTFSIPSHHKLSRGNRKRRTGLSTVLEAPTFDDNDETLDDVGEEESMNVDSESFGGSRESFKDLPVHHHSTDRYSPISRRCSDTTISLNDVNTEFYQLKKQSASSSTHTSQHFLHPSHQSSLQSIHSPENVGNTVSVIRLAGSAYTDHDRNLLSPSHYSRPSTPSGSGTLSPTVSPSSIPGSPLHHCSAVEGAAAGLSQLQLHPSSPSSPCSSPRPFAQSPRPLTPCSSSPRASAIVVSTSADPSPPLLCLDSIREEQQSTSSIFAQNPQISVTDESGDQYLLTPSHQEESSPDDPMDTSSLSPLTPPHLVLNASLSSPLPHSPNHQYSPRRGHLTHSPSLPAQSPLPPPLSFSNLRDTKGINFRGFSLDYPPYFDSDRPSITRGTGGGGIYKRHCLKTLPSCYGTSLQDNNNPLCLADGSCCNITRQDAVIVNRSPQQHSKQRMFINSFNMRHSFPPTEAEECSNSVNVVDRVSQISDVQKTESGSLTLNLPGKWCQLEATSLISILLDTLHSNAPYLTNEEITDKGIILTDSSGVTVDVEIMPLVGDIPQPALKMSRLAGDEFQYANLCHQLIASLSA